MKTLRQYKEDLCKEDPELAKRVEERVEQLKISEALRAARKAAGMTQEQVAQNMHVNRAYVSQLEGKPQNITIATLVKYAGAIGGDISLQISQTHKPGRRKRKLVHA